ncbi:DUF6264 family protein [Leifsonia poae]|uniref:DUF6264 family protein n=1 Tax=Leifsonia poae TaxID=110933 RepID=UPI003D67EB95
MADDDKQPDKRPRPQFGELAPEGWVWHPPADQDRLDTTRPVDQEAPAFGEQGPDAQQQPAQPHVPYLPSANQPPQPYQGQQYPGQQYPGQQYPGQPYPGQPYPPEGHQYMAPQLRRAAPRWNIGWTIALLVVGFLGMSYSIAVINAFPAAIELVHGNQNLGDYTPAPSVSGILTAGSITMGVIWVISAGITVWLLARRRLSFYVPLIAGIVAFIALFVFLSMVISTDPALLNYYGGITPTAVPTP